MQASPLYVHGRGENYGSSRKPTASWKPKAEVIQKRGASAQRTQADHLRRESMMSNSSQEPRASGKLDAVFSARSDERQNQFESSIFKFADPSKSARSLLEGNKDHLLSQGRSELMKQEHQVGSLNSFINDLQQQAYAQRLELQDAHHGKIESRREQAPLQEELSMKKKLLRETQIRNIHEFGEMKRAQELRVDEFSLHKLRESHDTTLRLTSTLQSMQEQMNSLNDSRDFHEVESNIVEACGTFPSSSSILSRDKRLPLNTWNSPGLQENVFGNQFSTFGSSRNPSQGIHYCAKPRETESVPRATGTGTSFARDDEQNKGTIPMPTFARRPSTMSSMFLWVFPRVLRPGSKDSKYQSCKSTNSILHILFFVRRFKNQVTTCSDIQLETFLWINEVEWIKIVAGKNFPHFEMLDAKIASALNKIIHNSHFKKKASLEEQQAQKEGRFLRQTAR